MKGKKKKPERRRIKCSYCGVVFFASRSKKGISNAKRKKPWELRGVISGRGVMRVRCVNCGKIITFRGRKQTTYVKVKKGEKKII